MQETPFVIQENEAGQRLDKALFAHFPSISRSQWQKRIEEGEALVNGKQTSVHYFLKKGDAVSVRASDNTHAPAPLPEIPILAETSDYLVINKPAGVVAHAVASPLQSRTQFEFCKEFSFRKSEPLLTDWLIAHYPEIKSVGEAPERPGIVHRLDKETSGVMALAKTQAAYESLRAQFKEHTTEKLYIALVHGNIGKDSGVIDFPLGRGADGRIAARPKTTKHFYATQEGREALTAFKVLRRSKHYTLLEALPKTGRTHQIRAHLFALGHPIVGDPLYPFHGRRGKKQPPPARLMLHATRLCFDDLEGKRACYESPMPEAFKAFSL